MQELTGGLPITMRRLNWLGKMTLHLETSRTLLLDLYAALETVSGWWGAESHWTAKPRVRAGNWVAEQWKWIKIKDNTQSNGVNCTRALRRARQQKAACKGDLGCKIFAIKVGREHFLQETTTHLAVGRHPAGSFLSQSSQMLGPPSPKWYHSSLQCLRFPSWNSCWFLPLLPIEHHAKVRQRP